MVKEFTQRTTLLRATTADLSVTLRHQRRKRKKKKKKKEKSVDIRLHPIHGIKRLIQKQSHRPTDVDPRRTIPVQRGIVIQHGQEIDDHEGEAGEGNLTTTVSIARTIAIGHEQSHTYSIGSNHRTKTKTMMSNRPRKTCPMENLKTRFTHAMLMGKSLMTKLL